MLVDTLSRPEQALVLATFLANESDATALAFVGDEQGRRCQQAAEEISAASSAERRQLLATLSRRLFRALPSHLERAHPSWLAERLHAEPAPLAALLAESLPQKLLAEADRRERPTCAPSPQLQATLLRIVLRGLPDLPAEAQPVPELQCLDDLACWPPDRLRALLRQLGLFCLAAWLRETPELQRPVLSRLPTADASALKKELRQELPALPHWPGPRCLEGGAPAADLVPQLGAELLGSALGSERGLPVALLLPNRLGKVLLQAVPGLDADLVLRLLRRARTAASEEVVPP